MEGYVQIVAGVLPFSIFIAGLFLVVIIIELAYLFGRWVGKKGAQEDFGSRVIAERLEKICLEFSIAEEEQKEAVIKKGLNLLKSAGIK